MAGMGPPPKPPHLRQRTNKVAGSARLPSADDAASNTVPDLPPRAEGWHRMLREWWESVWRSPMASEYLQADMKGGLYHLAYLHQLYWEATELGFGAINSLPKLAAEIRLQEVRFGLSPIDRRRLQWEVERGEQAAEKVQQRRQTKAAKSNASDPRKGLKLA